VCGFEVRVQGVKGSRVRGLKTGNGPRLKAQIKKKNRGKIKYGQAVIPRLDRGIQFLLKWKI